MRRIIVATLSAALVVIGLSAVLVGTASAATSNISVGGVNVNVCNFTSVSSIVDWVKSHNPTNSDDTLVTSAVVESALGTTLSDYRLAHCNGSGNGGNNGGHNNGGVYNGPRYGSCQEYGTHNLRDFSRGDVRYRADWDRNNNGIACDYGDVVVSNDGRCVTFRDQNRDYGNRYNSLYNVRLDQARSINSDGGRAVTRNEERAIEDAADLRDFRNRWTSTRDELRTICNDPTPEVQIITVPAAPVTTVTAAPPPPPAPSVGSIPSGSVNTGGWSPAFVLAHNRAV